SGWSLAVRVSLELLEIPEPLSILKPRRLSNSRLISSTTSLRRVSFDSPVSFCFIFLRVAFGAAPSRPLGFPTSPSQPAHTAARTLVPRRRRTSNLQSDTGKQGAPLQMWLRLSYHDSPGMSHGIEGRRTILHQLAIRFNLTAVLRLRARGCG